MAGQAQPLQLTDRSVLPPQGFQAVGSAPAPTPTPPVGQRMASSIRTLVAEAWQLTLGGKRGSTARTEDLFARTNPAVDGEECTHDCESCSARFPPGFKTEELDPLYGLVKGWSVHVLVATGKTDWTRNVAEEHGSVMEAIDKAALRAADGGRVMLSACDLVAAPKSGVDDGTGRTDYAQPTVVLVLPSLTLVEGVTPATVSSQLRQILADSPTTSSPLVENTSTDVTAPTGPTEDDSAIVLSPRLPPSLRQRACPHSAVILLCSQRTRDARCGQSAPILRKELQRHLRPLGLHRDPGDERPGGVGIVFVSHVGGHKYSANVLVYRRPNAFGLDHDDGRDGNQNAHPPAPPVDVGAAQCIWLARVRPADCENLVRYTVLRGKVVKPDTQLRGGFDRARGLTSW